MKIWQGYGTEHSANLVMIGRFQDVKDATKAHEIIKAITDQVQSDERTGAIKIGHPNAKYGDAMLNLLMKLNVNSLGSNELEQFVYDVHLDVSGKDIVITTDELDVSAFMKILVDGGARVEIYSAHSYKDTGYGR